VRLMGHGLYNWECSMIPGGERGGRPPYPDRDRGVDLSLKRLGGSTAFPTGRSKTTPRSAWATKFLWLTDSAGIPHRNAAWVFKSGLGLQATQACSKGHKSSLPQHGNMARVAKSSMPRWSWLRNSTSPTEEKDDMSTRAPCPRTGARPSADSDAGLDRTNTSREVYAGKGYAREEIPSVPPSGLGNCLVK